MEMNGFVQKMIREYCSGLELGPETLYFKSRTPEERRDFVREKLRSEVERDQSKFMADLIAETTEAVASAIEMRLELCSVCGDSRGPRCYEHLESELARMRSRSPFGKVTKVRRYRPAESVTRVATMLLSGRLANDHAAFVVHDADLDGLFALAERIVKHGAEMEEKIDRDLNPEDKPYTIDDTDYTVAT